MRFFEKFELVKKKKMYSIKYDGEVLALVSIKTLSHIIVNHVSKEIGEAILKQGVKKLENTPLESKALQLEKVYTKERKKFHRNKNIKSYTPKDKEFSNFIKAVEIIRRHDVSYEDFIKAQVKGLKFANNKRGIYPKTNHLCTMGAEERLLDYLQETRGTGNSEEIERIDLKHFDKTTPLMENPQFVAKWEKLDGGKADLRDAYYIKDCMIARNGRVTKVVRDYIANLEGANE